MSDQGNEGFWDEGPGSDPVRVAGRYRLPHPETGQAASWTAATTHAETLEDSYGLTRYQLRQVLIGLRLRPDVLRMLESLADEPDRAQLDEWIELAHEAAGSSAKANRGTAIHSVLQQVDRAWVTELGAPDPGVIARLPEWAAPYVAGYLAELARNGLSPIPTMTERRVINLALGCAGTFDNLYAEADGTVAMGDKKTGRLDYPERAYSIQLAVYQGADYLLDPDGGPPIDLRSLGLRREYAVLVHVDPESAAVTVYRVDLRRGRLGAGLAAEAREWRRQRHLLLPYVPPSVSQPEVRTNVGRHLTSVPSGPMEGQTRTLDSGTLQIFQLGEWMDLPDGSEVTITQPVADVVKTVVTSPGGATYVTQHAPNPGNEHSVNSTTASLGDVLAATAHTEADLMRLPKAELQRVLLGLDPGASVNHQRKILAAKIIKIQSGGRVATTTPKLAQQSQDHRPNKDPAVLPAGPATAGAEDPTDPHSAAFHRARLAEVAAAQSVGELGRIHQMVVRVGGDQAWTDALTEAARARVAVLDSGPLVDNDDPAAMLRAVTDSRQVADVWERVTVGGSVPERWTPELRALADRLLAELTPAPTTTNPYAPAPAGQ